MKNIHKLLYAITAILLSHSSVMGQRSETCLNFGWNLNNLNLWMNNDYFRFDNYYKVLYLIHTFFKYFILINHF